MLLETYQSPKQIISMTPLIDVVFILLLFFMLSSTFNRAKQLELKTVSSGTQVQQESEAIKILIQASGNVSVDGVGYSWNSTALDEQLQKHAASGQKVYLAATSQAGVQRLIQFIDQAKRTGITNLSLSESVEL